MKIYTLRQTQLLPIDLATAWAFFTSPANLAKITPLNMKFKILYKSGGEKAYAGQLIRYKITIPIGITLNWVTEITHVREPEHFIDVQLFGPYSLWHHQHHFKETEDGVEMTDELNYAVPFGILGRLTHWIFVERQVNAIFKHRIDVLNEIFPQKIK